MTASLIKDEIFRQYDVRGIVGRDLDYEVALQLGAAFAALLKRRLPEARKVSVGRDARLSSAELAGGVIEGIRTGGLDVVDIGLCPTPLQYFSLHRLGLDGGIMVTGSHNPPDYNGFKISIGKETIHGAAIQKLKRIIVSGAGAGAQKSGEVTSYDIIAAYRDYMLKEFSYLSQSHYRRVKVVVDAGNGTAGIVAPELLSAIGCSVVPLYCEPDGRFPNHHPDPTVVENIKDLIETTKRSGADFGVGYDGDGDRIGLVDGAGNIVWGDQLMVILSRDLLARRPGATIIGDVKCSQAMFDDIAARGGVPLMWKTGHSLVKQKMRDSGAPLAGEFSGHIFIGDRYFGFDDALYATFRLVEIMKRQGRGLEGLLDGLPRRAATPELRMDCPEGAKGPVVAAVVRRFEEYRLRGGSPYPIRDVSTIDGIRVVFEKGWGLVRASNTQPVIVLRFEAADEEALQAYRSFVTAEMERARDTVQLTGGAAA